MIELKEGNYYAAIWFVAGRRQDFMAALWRKLPSDNYEMVFRWRYYNDDKAFDSKDENSWWNTGATIPDEGAAIRSMDETIVEMLKAGFGGPVVKLILRTDDPMKIMDEMRKHKCFNLKEAERGA